MMVPPLPFNVILEVPTMAIRKKKERLEREK